MAAESPVGIRTQAFVVLAAVLLSAFSQMTLQPAAAPLAIELGLEPWHVGVAVAASAAMMLAAAPAWMRVMRTRGPRGPLVAALALAALAMAAFSSLAMLGARGMVDGWLLVAGLLLLRGVALGASLAAVGPAARIVLALVADPAERMRRFAAISSVQGIAVVMGVMLGGALSTFGALLPIAATPVLLAIAAAAVALGVAPGVPAAPPAPATAVPLIDRRTWAFGAVTLVLLSSVACLQVVLGFVLQQRLALDAATTGFATGAVLCAGGLSAVVAQTRIARAASRAIVPARVGLVLATVGIVGLVVADGLLGMVGAVVVGGAGVGLALSGLTGVTAAGPGGRPHAHRLLPQATVLGVVVGPPLGTLLLTVSDEAPFIACASLLLVAIAMAFAHPSFRAAPTPEPLAEPAAV